MDIRKRILFFQFFVLFFLLVGHDDHLAAEFVAASTATLETSEAYSNAHMARLIDEHINETANLCSGIYAATCSYICKLLASALLTKKII